jgi:hypothetical protein
MKEKLTLTIEKETKKRAKRYAKAEGRSISAMVEAFLNEISNEEDHFQPEPGSVTESLAGSLPLDDQRPYDQILTEALTKKYLANKNTD